MQRHATGSEEVRRCMQDEMRGELAARDTGINIVSNHLTKEREGGARKWGRWVVGSNVDWAEVVEDETWTGGFFIAEVLYMSFTIWGMRCSRLQSWIECVYPWLFR